MAVAVGGTPAGGRVQVNLQFHRPDPQTSGAVSGDQQVATILTALASQHLVGRLQTRIAQARDQRINYVVPHTQRATGSHQFAQLTPVTLPVLLKRTALGPGGTR